jgi:GntR family transcriptional regulator, transcriptional repressor for pyruvate dehydrogenase complex
MSAIDSGRPIRRRLTSPRIAETVANELRQQIIDGQLADGDLLPPQAVLVEKFNVSLVSLREALRILETEGLVSVRRGNRGGAVVHAPAKASTAYMLGLLLQSEDVVLGDLATALQELEPMCAALAAKRPDRAIELVPALHQLNSRMAELITEGRAFTKLGRQFHDTVVRGCGNHTVIAVFGSLEALWDSHRPATERSTEDAYPSAGERQAVLKSHTALTDAIELGDSDGARSITTRHLNDSKSYGLLDEASHPIVATSPHSIDHRPRDWRLI